MGTEKEIGQLLMIGLAGTRLSGEERAFLRRVQPAGVIYFKRNVESPKQLRALSREVVRLSTRTPLIAIDQEGGRVARLGAPFTEFPGNDYLGRCFERTRSDLWVTAQARIMGRELKSIGVNWDFAPVADVDSNPKNPVIGTRSFGRTPGLVSRLVAAAVRAFVCERVVSCAKHFPGHGDTFTDSHKVLPFVKASRATILRRELAPFRAAVRADVPTVMTAHVVYPALDRDRPATLSEKILGGLLRKKLGFSGVIVSDDLEMNAIAEHGLVHEAGVEALNAGVDLLLVCKSLERSEEVYRSLVQNMGRGGVLDGRAGESQARVRALKRSYLGWMRSPWPGIPAPGGVPPHREVAERIRSLGSAKVV